MDRARTLFELQIVLEQRTELEAKARRLQLEEQFERSGQGQLPLQQGYLQPPVQQQWQPAQQGPLPVLWPVQGVPPGWPGAWQHPPPGAAPPTASQAKLQPHSKPKLQP